MTEKILPAPPPELLDFLSGGKKFLIAGHKEPDADCIGSQLALGSTLSRLGKQVILVNEGPWARTEIADYAGRFKAAPEAGDLEGARLVIVDCTGADRTGDIAGSLAGLPTAIIDHHATNKAVCEARYVAPHSFSCCALILLVEEALGLTLLQEEAEWLLLGMCTDTGFFRFLDERGGEIFEAAARLCRAGANPKRTFAKINGGKTLASRLLLARVIGRTETFFDGRLAYTWEGLDDRKELGVENRDSDTLYRELQAVEGVEAIVVARQEKPDNVSIGFRSQSDVDVSVIAAAFGGGGHKNAAGAACPGTIAELKPQIIAKFAEIFKD
jgi:phosphoesterase RecJ-like protein